MRIEDGLMLQEFIRFYCHFWSKAVHDSRNRLRTKKKLPVVLEVNVIVSMKRIDISTMIGVSGVCFSNIPAYFA